MNWETFVQNLEMAVLQQQKICSLKKWDQFDIVEEAFQIYRSSCLICLLIVRGKAQSGRVD